MKRVVPLKIALAAATVLDYLGDDENHENENHDEHENHNDHKSEHPILRSYLKSLVDAPHYTPCIDPKVFVWCNFEWESPYYTSRTVEARIPLHTYFTVLVNNSRFNWDAVRGKPIRCDAEDFQVRWSFDEEDSKHYDCSQDWYRAFDECDEQMRYACCDYVDEMGAFLPSDASPIYFFEDATKLRASLLSKKQKVDPE